MIFWISWFVIGICLVGVFTGVALPRLMLWTYASVLPIGDRPAGRTADEHGAVLWFEPSPSARPFFKSYKIARDEKGLYFCGEFAKKTAYLCYELVVYNSSNRIISILRVKEKFNGGKETEITRLPAGADVVGLRVLCADDTPIPAERRVFHAGFALRLLALAFCVAVAVDLLLFLTGTFVLRCLDGFTMTGSLPAETWGLLLGCTGAGVIVLVTAFAFVLLFAMRQRRKEE